MREFVTLSSIETEVSHFCEEFDWQRGEGRMHRCSVSFSLLHSQRHSFVLKTIFTLRKTGTSAVTRFHGERLSPIPYRKRYTL